MKNLYILNSVFVILCLISCGTKNNIRLEPEKPEVDYKFPTDWIGDYEGVLDIYNAKGKSMSVDMKLSIGVEDSLGYYPWILQYGDQDIREYAIKRVDSLGHYMMDEYNGILIDSYHLGNKFISQFSVMSNEIITICERMDYGLQFEIISSGTDSLSNTFAIEGEERYDVTSFPVRIYQKAKLKNKKTLSK